MSIIFLVKNVVIFFYIKNGENIDYNCIFIDIKNMNFGLTLSGRWLYIE